MIDLGWVMTGAFFNILVYIKLLKRHRRHSAKLTTDVRYLLRHVKDLKAFIASQHNEKLALQISNAALNKKVAVVTKLNKEKAEMEMVIARLQRQVTSLQKANRLHKSRASAQAGALSIFSPKAGRRK